MRRGSVEGGEEKKERGSIRRGDVKWGEIKSLKEGRRKGGGKDTS